MYLSKLEIVGFKSFAQKVNLTFDSGISAIVGPNGCGKTNIVDAIRWVLGEQRYATLRSDKMEDVIFNGTKTRKALGMAEASLLIENTKGILPSEYTQVTIGRRVYRSGESEYLLNKAPCRLKDILDLFMDTGMGSDAYSVIELKMVETILSDKTDERRRLFEEAAGVTKYKHRRKAAMRKLEAVQADLVRVNDIVTEVQKAVNSLERQARKAEQYNELRARLRGLEIDLMEREYAQLIGRMTPLSEKVAALHVHKSSIDSDLSHGEEELEILRARLLEADKHVAETQRDVSQHREKMHTVEQISMVAAERTRALHANIARFEAEQEELRGQQQQTAEQEVALKRQINDLTAQESAAATELQERQESLRTSEAALAAKKTELQALNERTISLVQEIAGLQTEQDRKHGRAENLNGRHEHAAGENAVYEEESIRLEEQIASFSIEDKQLRRSFTEAEMRYYNAESRKKDLRARADVLQQQALEIRTEMDRRTARIDFLKGLIESREGLSEGVRYLSSSSRWTPSRNLIVADALHAEERYRPAIEAALGEFAGLLVVEHAADAEQGIALLKDDQRGKATFVCLDRMPEISSRLSLGTIPGVCGWAADIATYEPAFAPLFHFIFDGVLVVEDAATAAVVSSRFPGIRCVTVEGEVSTGVGITRGGSKRTDEGGIIGKQQQIADLQKENAGLAATFDGIISSIDAATREHDEIDLKAFTDAVKSIEKEMNGVEMRIAQLAFEKKRAADIIAKNTEEMVSLASEAETLEAEIAGRAPGLDALKESKADVERTLGAVTHELEGLEEEWNARSQEVNDFGIALVKTRGEIQNAVNSLARAGQAAEEIAASIEKFRAEAEKARAAILTTEASVAENQILLEGLRHELTTVEATRTGAEVRAAEIREEIHRIELAIKDQRRTHDESMREVHEGELQLAELKSRVEHIRARAQEEFEFDVRLKPYPDDEFVDFAALRQEIPALRDKIKSLGNVNFAAFEEYQTEKQRCEFMTSQRNDLIEAEKTLLATIEEINATAQRKFLETFALIRKNFIETFKSLFDPGDECDLRLEEDVDPLEAKIEIVAKPRGKRPTSIDLLSGGEKTLTATALLFAIYLVKPSPFCILDEVDAPLDDANVDRFTRILKKFSNNTQFIVVTHNKRTMEAANALYGVTMEEEGVSKLVTVRFNQGAQVQSAALASG